MNSFRMFGTARGVESTMEVWLTDFGWCIFVPRHRRLRLKAERARRTPKQDDLPPQWELNTAGSGYSPLRNVHAGWQWEGRQR